MPSNAPFAHNIQLPNWDVNATSDQWILVVIYITYTMFTADDNWEMLIWGNDDRLVRSDGGDKTTRDLIGHRDRVCYAFTI